MDQGQPCDSAYGPALFVGFQRSGQFPMNRHTLLFPKPLLPPVGVDVIFEELEPDELPSWLSVLPAGGPGYLLSPENCHRNVEAGGEADQPPVTLELYPAGSGRQNGLELDFELLDRSITSAWKDCTACSLPAPADWIARFFSELAGWLDSAAAGWGFVWSWENRSDDIEICLRAVTIRSDAEPVLYYRTDGIPHRTPAAPTPERP